MKIGIYGDSFNPCHLNHKKIVMDLLDNQGFDKIIILPTGNYHNKKNLLNGEYRIEMLKLMFDGESRVEVSDYEFINNLIFTYRSLDYYSRIYSDSEIILIISVENFVKFDTWKKYDYILDNYKLNVIARNGIDVVNRFNVDIEVTKLDLDIITANQIRDYLLHSDDNVKNYLDKKVYEYIQEKGFYHKDYEEEITYINQTDKEFLKNYDSSQYEKMSITTDITLFSVSDIDKDNYRQVSQKAFSVLLCKRTRPPFKEKWCLPGGFLSLDETLVDCAKRVLFTETNLDDIYLEQLYTFSDLDRDMRGRVLSASYLGLVDKNLIEKDLKQTASFFKILLKEENNVITITFDNGKDVFSCKALKEKDMFGLETFKVLENDYLAFDHLLIILTSIKRLQSKINYTDIVFHMMPKEFTLKELQLVYEAILDKKLLDPVFRRNIGDLVVKTDNVRSDGGHRPAALYTKKEEY